MVLDLIESMPLPRTVIEIDENSLSTREDAFVSAAIASPVATQRCKGLV